MGAENDRGVRPSVICLAGVTGAGKTEAALFLAERFGGAVINFDSRQVYRGLAVVTAQPSPGERAVCPHVLYGFLPPDRKLGAGTFAKKAGAAIAWAGKRGHLPLLVGGTGLYLRAVLGGLDPIPPVPDEARQEALRLWETLGPLACHARLAQCDPEYAARIHANDRQRVSRALEVFFATGRPFSSWHAGGGDSPYRVLKLGLRLPGEEHAARLERRIQAMLAGGALTEVRAALAAHGASARAMNGIGCAELAAHLRGELSLEEACALWLKNTRAYAKRQMTWFRKEEGLRWFEPGENEAMAGEVERFLGADDASGA